jgi:upstream activation factor subunit UAF30
MSSKAKTAAPVPVAAAPAKKAEAVKPVATAPVPAPVVAAPAPVPVAAKKAAVKAVEAPAPAPIVAPAPKQEETVVTEAPAVVAEGGAVATTETTLGSGSEEKLKAVVSRVNELLETLRAVSGELKLLQKQVSKDFKEAAKSQRSRRGKRRADAAAAAAAGGAEKAKRSPSGFAKPTLISDELCAFLKVPIGTQLARTEVTRKITEYIKANSLQNQANKKIILPDATLGSLLKAGDAEVTYFNLQKYLKTHFTKS